MAMVIRRECVALIGTLVGLLSNRSGARDEQSLYEVSPGDPYIVAAASVVLRLAGFAAWLGPAPNGSVQPLVALRQE